MTLPDSVPTGTPSRRAKDPNKGDTRNPNAGNNGGPKASAPSNDNKGNGGKKNGKHKFSLDTLNPPFDPRMRRIGSPLNLTNKIKRGWIQSADGDGQKVAFLFNPSQLDLSHSIDPSLARNPQQTPKNDVMDPDYPTIGSTTGVKLLYDRTYELFSPAKSGKLDFANKYGVWADVAAWYVYLGLLPEMPDSWENSLITDPPLFKNSYLFVGPKLVYYGWVTGINVTYSHWSMQMVPSRCAVDVSFQILPHTGAAPIRNGTDAETAIGTWMSDYFDTATNGIGGLF